MRRWEIYVYRTHSFCFTVAGGDLQYTTIKGGIFKSGSTRMHTSKQNFENTHLKKGLFPFFRPSPNAYNVCLHFDRPITSFRVWLSSSICCRVFRMIGCFIYNPAHSTGDCNSPNMASGDHFIPLFNQTHATLIWFRYNNITITIMIRYEHRQILSKRNGIIAWPLLRQQGQCLWESQDN